MTTPTIPAGNLFMNATLYTGTGAAQTITNGGTGTSFQPDLVWFKCRSIAYNNNLFDSIRGAGQDLRSNLTSTESTTSEFTSFNSNGWSFSGVTTNGFNDNGATYVGWNWKAGGTAVSNTSGSITSSVSANTTSGFSVVTYTGNGTAGATVGHGLGVAPSMIINKSRSTSPTDWGVYHASKGNTGAVFLNLTDAFTTNSGYWNNTSPTSSVFTLGLAGNFNQSGQTYVSYCWAPIAGYSAFGSYTGNGSTDGPFVYLGFRPRFVMTKSYDATAGAGDWTIHDTSRNPYNTADLRLFANSSAAESSSEAMDMNSNGFKIRATNSNCNTSGGGYIYMAFAENPFKYALAR